VYFLVLATIIVEETMKNETSRTQRRYTVTVNYFCLVLMNVCFYFVWVYKDMSGVVDVVGIGALIVVAGTFFLAHWKTGLWHLTHARSDVLDERQLQVTHDALSRSYGVFAVISLAIMMTHAVVYGLVPSLDFVLSVPLVVSLLYLAHTLPGSFLAWSETRMPGTAK